MAFQSPAAGYAEQRIFFSDMVGVSLEIGNYCTFSALFNHDNS